jgi:hypothetical protein
MEMGMRNLLISCDTLALKIQKLLTETLQQEKNLEHISRIKFDLDNGKVKSTKKTIIVKNTENKNYRITIEEC